MCGVMKPKHSGWRDRAKMVRQTPGNSADFHLVAIVMAGHP